MRRATVLVLAVLPFLGTTLPAAETPKPLKTKESAPALVVLTSEPGTLPDIEVCTLPLGGAVCHSLKQRVEYVLPGSCVAAIEKTPAFKCSGPDRNHLKCSGISLTIRGKVDECLEIHVEKEK